MATLGGIKDSPASNSAEIDGLARFAVDEHNKKEVCVCVVFDLYLLIVNLSFTPWLCVLFY